MNMLLGTVRGRAIVVYFDGRLVDRTGRPMQSRPHLPGLHVDANGVQICRGTTYVETEEPFVATPYPRV